MNNTNHVGAATVSGVALPFINRGVVVSYVILTAVICTAIVVAVKLVKVYVVRK